MPKIDIYGLKPDGQKEKIGAYFFDPTGLLPVGGKIFYIDETSDEVVQFYNSNGLPVPVSVGSSPTYYKVLDPGTSGKDKFYVYKDSVYGICTWTFKENGSAVNESLGTLDGIGKGKSNTEIVMTAGNGKYIKSESGYSNYPTIWYKIKQLRDQNELGCSDWYVPSLAELTELRDAIGYIQLTHSDAPVVVPVGSVTGGLVAGVYDGQPHYVDVSQNIRMCYPSYTVFLYRPIPSSTEASSTNISSWNDVMQFYSNNRTKSTNQYLIPIRSF